MKNFLTLLLFFISTAVFSQTFVSKNGQLKLKGKQLCNQYGKPVQLKGFNTYNISYCPECVKYEAIKSNRDFWGANMVRITVYVDDTLTNKHCYYYDPEFNKPLIDNLVKWSESLGMYCIIDWHVLKEGNPNAKIHSGAVAFFNEMSTKYKNKKHVLYEICNEPNGDNVTWKVIAGYANRIIPVIHKNSPDAIVIVGTPEWSQLLDQVDPSLLTDTNNVMYSFHFYAASHAGLLPMFLKEIHRIPVFTTEWGACENTGNDNVNFNVARSYVNAMKQNVMNGDTVIISWGNFSYSDVDETASSLKPGSCKQGKWENMTPTGFFVRDCLLQP
jgi:aryl-phospho-beta-D-glucosidase BglC (GH1 family)